VAHVLVATYVLATQDVDDVLVIPTFDHPLEKQTIGTFEQRLEMCRLAMADLRRVTVSAIEGELGGASRTLRTLETLKARAPDRGLRLVMGVDLLAEVDRWYAFDRIRAIAPPILIGRRGSDVTADAHGLEATLPLADVSSSEVRRRLAASEDVDSLVPRTVEQYIRARGLYGAAGR
jgi:nicotinate-nucleotide adenylyltransferase